MHLTGRQFKAWRIALWFTQNELAQGLGVSGRAIENWEQGKNAVPEYAADLIKGLALSRPGMRLEWTESGWPAGGREEHRHRWAWLERGDTRAPKAAVKRTARRTKSWYDKGPKWPDKVY